LLSEFEFETSTTAFPSGGSSAADYFKLTKKYDGMRKANIVLPDRFEVSVSRGYGVIAEGSILIPGFHLRERF
jgi:hypothetical protein